MIVSGYSLDLYCENKEDYNKHKDFDWPVTFAGETRHQCIAQARQQGWRVNFKNKTAYCPLCSGK